jgi:hypothetical protein
MENCSIFYGHLEYLPVISYILWPFGNAVVKIVIYITVLACLCQEKIWQPCSPEVIVQKRPFNSASKLHLHLKNGWHILPRPDMTKRAEEDI